MHDWASRGESASWSVCCQTALREWAYAKPYRASRARAGALGPFLTSYNTMRPHTAHDRKPPISRLSA